mmetsp:Transcript_36654/g.96001  ORF Transcript_36654/g.96001 Transcript_36654/m.96001 type:complete len:335 (-) Transcript_36654:216-1220(-)|eukprot:CAMPEP_0182928510 /NCGR_PEP_ID=MMETSP0105_2-20130417/15624_1 /TAXON_ID=81532 ORGANISM="Acanthoeca-like sp., Strain 10tr" /NCGR_SAMPLE_ID=MMETSP0105_2 /ASSEMBLY_ACC=CAM_ASM_000205 /LENGTH=334 /DNA_ID=CAMNT_0025066515 /DNA_START=62 /DNA_END=1066 /DNA_ORIENTATION=-
MLRSPQPYKPVATDLSKRFKLGEKIGSGAFATIYSATDLQSKKTVAIKKLGRNKKGVLPTGEYTISKDLKHPNIIRTLDCLCSQGEMWLSLELYTGGDLFSVLDPTGPGLDERVARKYMVQLADGMAYLHDRSVVHSDIKPENVLLHHGTVKICDFGLAGEVGTLRKGSSKGTGAYMSPQLVNRRDTTRPYALEAAQDVWSYGVVLYAVLFADLPWEKARPADPDFKLFCELGGVSPRVHPFQHVSGAIRRFFKMLFAFNPKKRPSMQQCAEFLKASTQWYREVAMKRSSISFGMKENPNFRADLLSSSTSSNESSPSLSDDGAAKSSGKVLYV